MYKDFTDKFWRLTDEAKAVAITTHVDPDSDAVASLLAMYYVLKEKYPQKRIEMILAAPPEEKLNFLTNFSQIQVTAKLSDALKDFDLAIFLDANYDVRFGLTPAELESYPGRSICLDHHESKAFAGFTLTLLEPSSASATELIYFSLLESREKINPELGEILLTGLMSDTYRFQYIMPEQARVFDMAKRLVVDGNLSVEKLQLATTGLTPQAFAAIKGFMATAEIKEVPGWPKFIAAYVSRDFAGQAGLTDKDIHEGKENFAGYLKNISGVTWGVVLYPKSQGDVRVSFRSTNNGPNVRKIAEAMSIGSGHDRAAGATYVAKAGEKLEPAECLEKIVAWLAQNKI